MHLDLRALQRAVKKTAKEEGFFVGDVGRKRYAELRALALDSRGGGRQRVSPRRPVAADGRGAQPRRIVHVRVVESAAVADPALVDVVVLARGDAHELAAALPHRRVAADRALVAHALGVGHVPRARFETPHTRRECADGAEVDDVAAEVRL